MENRDIKSLFEEADKQFPINDRKKQGIIDFLLDAIDKKTVILMSKRSVLKSLFIYIDKVYFVIYGALICLGLAFILFLQQLGIDPNGMLTVCVVGAGGLSVISISLINRLFFGKMAELGASYYFSTKQCVAAYLAIAGAINLVILMITAFYLGLYWKISLFQVILYVLTPFLISSMISLGILSTELGRTSYLLGLEAFFLSVVYVVICSIPGIFMFVSLWMWGIAVVIAGIMVAVQLGRLFKQMEEGEMLCMN